MATDEENRQLVMRRRIWKQELYWASNLFLTVIFNIYSAADYCLDLLNNYIFCVQLWYDWRHQINGVEYKCNECHTYKH